MNLATKHKQIGVAVIVNQRGEILIDRRRQENSFGGFWEFPGGKVETGETVEQCIVREVQEEIGITVAVKETLLTIEHQYPELRVTLHVCLCNHLSGQPQPLDCAEVRWVAVGDLGSYQFPEANQAIIACLQQRAGIAGHQ